MGGTGALMFCGDKRFQLIISKRNPNIVSAMKEEGNSNDMWGFTIVRRDLPKKGAGAVRTPVYKYLAPVDSGYEDGKKGVLRFYANSL